MVFLKTLYKNLNNHFQIAFGEGANKSVDIDFNQFCTKYGLNPILTHNGLKLLDQHSIISLSESFIRKSTLKFLANKDRLFRYIERNEKMGPVIQTLLRTYGGLFDFETNIDLKLIERKTRRSEKEVLNALHQLNIDGLVDCAMNQTDLEITFLLPREDDRTLNTISHKIINLEKQKRWRFEKMISYVENESKCRASFLLEYFEEENIKDCGICDICKSNSTNFEASLDKLKNTLLRVIKKQPKSSRELVSLLQIDEGQLLIALKELLEDELLVLTKTNAYKTK